MHLEEALERGDADYALLLSQFLEVMYTAAADDCPNSCVLATYAFDRRFRAALDVQGNDAHERVARAAVRAYSYSPGTARSNRHTLHPHAHQQIHTHTHTHTATQRRALLYGSTRLSGRARRASRRNCAGSASCCWRRRRWHRWGR